MFILRLTIHQPEFLPWLGFFHKISLADTVVILDDIQYRHQYFQNRNKIRTNNGWAWLIVPVKHQPLDEWRINTVDIDRNNRWCKKIIRSIEVNYSKCPFFSEYWTELRKILNDDYSRIIDLNMDIIKYLLHSFDMKKNIRFSSEFGFQTKKSDLIFDICKIIGTTTYVSGISGKVYLDVPRFVGANIPVEFQTFHHPIYQQRHSPFIPCMSSIDLLFNHGPNSKDILHGIGVESYETVFK